MLVNFLPLPLSIDLETLPISFIKLSLYLPSESLEFSNRGKMNSLISSSFISLFIFWTKAVVMIEIYNKKQSWSNEVEGWTVPDSNRSPLPCHGSALPNELTAQC